MQITISIVICTKDRPKILNRCLIAIFQGSKIPNEIIVSDDSAQGEKNMNICGMFPRVIYVRGPQRGLCANRNFAIQTARADFVSLLDDDTIVGTDFVSKCFNLIANAQSKIIWTGPILEAKDANPFLSYLGFSMLCRRDIFSIADDASRPGDI